MAYDLLEPEAKGFDVIEPEAKGYELVEPESKPPITDFTMPRERLLGGMMDPGTGKELTTAIAEDPKAFIKAISDIAFGAAAAPGKFAYEAAADVVSKVTGDPQYGGNLAAGMQGGDRPVDKFFGEVAKTSRVLGIAGHLSASLPELATMMVVNPEGAAGRLLALGFSADMINKSRPMFTEYADELGKDEPDPAKLASLEAGLLTTAIMAPLAAKHGVSRVALTPGDASIVASRMLTEQVAQTAPMTAEALEANRRLGVTVPEELKQPGAVLPSELSSRALAESQQRIITGEQKAIDVLKAQRAEIIPMTTAALERTGGGEALFGKESYNRELRGPSALAQTIEKGATDVKAPDETGLREADAGSLPVERPPAEVAPTETPAPKETVTDFTGITREQFDAGVQSAIHGEMTEFLDKFGTEKTEAYLKDILQELADDPDFIKYTQDLYDSIFASSVPHKTTVSPVTAQDLLNFVTEPHPTSMFESAIGNFVRKNHPEVVDLIETQNRPMEENANIYVTSKLINEHGLDAGEVRAIFDDYASTGRKELYDLDPGLGRVYDLYTKGDNYREFVPEPPDVHGGGESTLAPEQQATSRKNNSPEAFAEMIAQLEALKSNPGPGGLPSLPHPEALKAIGKAAWNTAIDIAIAGLKAGKAFKDAIEDAMGHLRKNVKGFDEAQTRANLGSIVRSEAVPDTTGDSVKMRKSAARATTAPEIPSEVQSRIKTAPESQYRQQSEARVEDAVTSMSSDQLASVPPTSNLYVAARLESANRLFQAGKMEEGYQVFVELEKQGTSFGQNINQFKRLKGTQPEFIAFALNERLRKAGRDPLTPAQETRIIETAKASKASDVALDKASRAWQADPSEANARRAEAALDTANSTALDLQRQVAKFQPRTLPGILKSVLQGNLLTPMSQSANIVGNMSFIPFRAAVHTIASALDTVDDFIHKQGRQVSAQPITGTIEAAKGLVRGAKQIPSILARGTGETIKGETHTGLHPLRAWVSQFAEHPEMPTRAGALTLGDRVGLLVEGTLGIHAEVMLRLLGSGDAPFKEAAKARATAEQLKLAKVPKDQWAFAHKFPELFLSEDAISSIRQQTLAAVFQGDSTALNAFNNWIKNNSLAKKMMRIGVSPDWLDLAVATVAPYKLTPLNIIREILSYNPLLAVANTLASAKLGERRAAKMNAGKFMVASMLTASGWWLYKSGLLSPALDERDESQKSRILAGEVMPPNHLNISGLKRALEGGDPAFKSGDETVDVFRAGGLAGSVFYMTANIGRDLERRPQVDDSEIWKSILTQSTLEQARFGMNQSFLSGVEGMLSAVKDGNADSYVRQWANTVTAIPLPNTLGAISRATRQYKPDLRGDSLTKDFTNIIRNRLGFAGLDDYLPLKRGLWGEPLRETPEGRNAILYQFFDISKNKQVTSDPVPLELYRLWRATDDTKVIPAPPAKNMTIDKVTYVLDAAQQSRRAELVGQMRRKIVEQMVINPEFHLVPDEQKVDLLTRAYDLGAELGNLQFRQEAQGKLTPKPQKAGFKEAVKSDPPGIGK